MQNGDSAQIFRQQKRQLELNSIIERLNKQSSEPENQKQRVRLIQAWKRFIQPLSRQQYSKRMNEREINSLLKQTWLGK